MQSNDTDRTMELLKRETAQKKEKRGKPSHQRKNPKKLTERPGGQRDVAAHAGDAGQNPKPEGALPGEPAGPGRAQGRRGPAVVEGVGQGLHRPEEHCWEFLKVLFFFEEVRESPSVVSLLFSSSSRLFFHFWRE
jgi:hypothetical protein